MDKFSVYDSIVIRLNLKKRKDENQFFYMNFHLKYDLGVEFIAL